MKIIKKLTVVFFVLAALVYFVGMPILQKQTKKHSPEKVANYEFKGTELEVRYSSP